MRAACSILGVSVALLAPGCNKSSPTKQQATTSSATASNAPKPAASQSPNAALEAVLIVVAQTWNTSLAKHDPDKLADVYGERVQLYTTSTDRAGAIKMKTAALKAAPDYTQSMGPIDFILRDPKVPRAEFEKTWTQNGTTSKVRASLTFAREGSRYVIVEESDAKTESRVAKDGDGCAHWVHRVVTSTDEGQEFVPPKFSTFYVCGPPECPKTQIDAKFLTGESYFMTIGTFYVDEKTGVVERGGEELKANPAVVAKMKAACAKEN